MYIYIHLSLSLYVDIEVFFHAIDVFTLGTLPALRWSFCQDGPWRSLTLRMAFATMDAAGLRMSLTTQICLVF
jgi:hypothetical protein